MKNVVITGANSGLGLQAAKHLLIRDYGVILACRSIDKANSAKEWLVKETKKENIIVRELDLSSLTSIREFSERTNEEVYGLICNAGIWNMSPTKYTKDGFEETFGVNHLGHFLLTNLLLKKFDRLKRIAIVSSSLHDPEAKGPFAGPNQSSAKEFAFPKDEKNPDWSKVGALRYVNSKLANIYFTHQLDKKLKQINRNDITVNAFNPGFMPDTGLNRESSFFQKIFLTYILSFVGKIFKFVRKPDDSGNALADLISNINVSGKYFDGKNEIPSSKESYNQEKASQLWLDSIELIKMTENETPF